MEKIFNCLEFGDFQEFKFLVIKTPNFNVNSKINGETLLHLACRKGKLNIVKYLVDVLKADIDVENSNKLTPLIICLSQKDGVIASYLLDCQDEMKKGNKKTDSLFNGGNKNDQNGFSELKNEIEMKNSEIKKLKKLIEKEKEEVNNINVRMKRTTGMLIMMNKKIKSQEDSLKKLKIGNGEKGIVILKQREVVEKLEKEVEKLKKKTNVVDDTEKDTIIGRLKDDIMKLKKIDKKKQKKDEMDDSIGGRLMQEMKKIKKSQIDLDSNEKDVVLKQTIKELRQEIEKYKIVLKSQENYKIVFKSQKQKIDGLSLENESCRERVSIVEENLKEREIFIQKQGFTIENLQEEIKMKNSSTINSEVCSKSNEKEIIEKQKQKIDDLQLEIDKIKKSNNDAKKNDDFEEKIKKLNEKNDLVGAQRDLLDESLEELKKKNKKMKMYVNSLEERIMSFKRRDAHLNQPNEIEYLKKELEKQQDEYSELRTKYYAKTEELNLKTRKLRALEKNLGSGEELKDLKKEKKKAVNQIVTLKETLNESNNKIIQLELNEKKSSLAMDQIISLNKTIRGLKKKVKQLELEKSDLEKKNSQLELGKSDKDSEEKSSSDNIETSPLIINTFFERIKKLENENKLLREKMNTGSDAYVEHERFNLLKVEKNDD